MSIAYNAREVYEMAIQVERNGAAFYRKAAKRFSDREVRVTGPSGDVDTVTLADDVHGVASAAIAVDEPGLYRLSDGIRTAVAAVGNLNPLEYADLRASPEPLAPEPTPPSADPYLYATVPGGPNGQRPPGTAAGSQ